MSLEAPPVIRHLFPRGYPDLDIRMPTGMVAPIERVSTFVLSMQSSSFRRHATVDLVSALRFKPTLLIQGCVPESLIEVASILF